MRTDEKTKPRVKARVNNVQEARKLLETGFEYVCSHNDKMLFRKRK